MINLVNFDTIWWYFVTFVKNVAEKLGSAEPVEPTFSNSALNRTAQNFDEINCTVTVLLKVL